VVTAKDPGLGEEYGEQKDNRPKKRSTKWPVRVRKKRTAGKVSSFALGFSPPTFLKEGKEERHWRKKRIAGLPKDRA